ncbi:pyrimidine dimer DNA glycosylase/endonuclease V [Dermabacter hominis]
MNPAYLDRMALVACWREALLAQKVLAGLTKGYTKHPQLERFRESADPQGSIGAFLLGIAREADSRGYSFDHSKIHAPG